MERLNNFEQDFFGLTTSLGHIPEECITHSMEDFAIKMSSVKLDEHINPLKLKDYLFDQFSNDWIDWSPETVMLDILDGSANDLLMDKIAALQLCYRTDTPWTEWHIFEKVGRTFTSQDVDFLTFQPLTTGECSVTMEVMHNLRPEEKFTEEIHLYVANIAFGENLVYLPREMFKVAIDDKLRGMIYYPDLRAEVKESWEKIYKINVIDATFNLENPTQNQLALLTVLKQYRKEFYE